MKKTKFMAVLAGVLLGAVLLGACGETDVEKVEGKKASAEQKEKKEKKKDEVYKVGDTIKVDGLEITITKAAFKKPEQYSTAEKGNVLDLTIETKNSGDDKAFIDNTEFNLYDKEGNKLDSYYGYSEMAISGDINKGKKLSGHLFFDVPKHKSYELIYQPSFSWDDKEIKYNIIPK
ncbi:DUF4352 domain-containing protein [Bacillus altitudinis]|uniref:DUF4352 domain-containing protein n=1 Tax=Bacillus altitudinis TaxID=293387 RepID=UPI00389A3E43